MRGNVPRMRKPVGGKSGSALGHTAGAARPSPVGLPGDAADGCPPPVDLGDAECDESSPRAVISSVKRSAIPESRASRISSRRLCRSFLLSDLDDFLLLLRAPRRLPRISS